MLSVLIIAILAPVSAVPGPPCPTVSDITPTSALCIVIAKGAVNVALEISL